MADVTLTVGVNTSLSYKEMQRGISDVISDLNNDKYGIKIGIDSSSLKSMKSQLQEMTKSVSSGSKGSGFDSISTSIKELSSAATQSKTSLESIASGITEISAALQNMISALPESGSALSQMAKEGSVGVESLKAGLQGLLDLVTQLNAKDFSVVNSFSYKESGIQKTDVEELSLYKQKATELIAVIEQMSNAFASLRKYTTTNGNGFQESLVNVSAREVDAAGEIANAYFQIAQAEEQVNSATTMKPVQTAISSLETLYSAQQKVLNQISARGVDTTGLVDTSKLDAANSALNEYTSKGEQARETFLEAAQSVAQFGSAAQEVSQVSDTTSSSSQVEQVKTMCSETSALLDELRVKIEQTFDLSTVPLNAQSIYDVIEQIKTQLNGIEINVSGVSTNNVSAKASADSVTSTVASVQSVASAANTATSGIQKMSASLNQVNAEKIRAALQSIDGISDEGAQKLVSALDQAEVNITNISTRWKEAKNGQQQILDLIVKGNNAQGQTVQYTVSYSQKTGEVASNVTKISQAFETTAQKTKAVEQSVNTLTVGSTQYNSAITQVNNTLKEVANNAQKWSQAQAGANPEAYNTYTSQAEALSQLLDNLKTGTVTASEFSNEYSRIKSVMAEAARGIASANSTVASLDAQEKLANSTRDKANLTITQLTNVLERYSAAQKSSNDSSRSAYMALETQRDTIKELLSTYDGSPESINKLQAAIASANSAIKESTVVIKANGDATKSLSGRLSELATKFGSWLSVSQVMMTAIRSMKQMVSTSIEIEDAMAQLQIVTKATDSELESFLTKATSLAKELGQSVTDVASAIETFTRLGYSFDESSELAEFATILANVADTDVDTATTGLTSIIKGYSLEASDAEHIADVLVTVGQEYAISAEELMEAFERGGAALSATGSTIEESAALFAASNAALQNASSVGTMWKTVSARIRGRICAQQAAMLVQPVRYKLAA